MSSQAGTDLGVKVQAQAKRRADDDLPVQGTKGSEVASEMRADRAARLQRPGPWRPSEAFPTSGVLRASREGRAG